mgnify:CR=1 FL=1
MVKFFINRPIFATVLALIIVVAGLVTLNILPIAQYPEITPPTVQVSAVYPGADAQTVAQTVGLPIEQQVNGVDGMLYMSSNSSSSGAYSLTITFAVGTDIDMATVMVQNRVSIAQSSLPEPVIVQGITTRKQSSNIVMMLTLSSKDSIYDGLYLSNYATLNMIDQLTRLPGVGSVQVMGAGNYSMRIWLDPEAMRIRNLTPDMVYQATKKSCEAFLGAPIADERIAAITKSLAAQMQNVVLIGMPGSGKTTIGTRLAAQLGRTFLDADTVLEQKAGMNIPEIFRLEGEDGFRQRETAVLAELGKRSGLVIATGGGCVTRPENYPLLHQNGTIFCLTRDLSRLPISGRPVSQALGAEGLYRRRKPLYEKFADAMIDNDHTVEDAVRQILEVLG